LNHNQSFRQTLEEYLTIYLCVTENYKNFVSFNIKTNGNNEPVKRGIDWKIIIFICREVELPANFGTHNLIKTGEIKTGCQGLT